MNSSKDTLLALLKRDPYLSQQDLADQLGLSRSAVAGHIAQLMREGRILGRAYVLPNDDRAPLLCIGAANWDRKLRTVGPARWHSSNPASQSESAGGVARNVAENLARLGLPVQLLTAVGEDPAGATLLEQLQALGASTQGSLRLPNCPTGSYTAVLDAEGDLLIGLAQMQACEALDVAWLQRCQPWRLAAGWTVADLNLPADTLAELLREAAASARPLACVAVSVPKMARLPQDLRGLSLLLLNRDELAACAGLPLNTETDLQTAHDRLAARGLARLVVTQGEGWLWLGEAGAPLRSLQPPPLPPEQRREVTGAGDAFAAGVLAGLQRGHDLRAACQLGLRLAHLTLQSDATVSPLLSPSLLEEALT